MLKPLSSPACLANPLHVPLGGQRVNASSLSLSRVYTKLAAGEKMVLELASPSTAFKVLAFMDVMRDAGDVTILAIETSTEASAIARFNPKVTIADVLAAGPCPYAPSTPPAPPASPPESCVSTEWRPSEIATVIGLGVVILILGVLVLVLCVCALRLRGGGSAAARGPLSDSANQDVQVVPKPTDLADNRE